MKDSHPDATRLDLREVAHHAGVWVLVILLIVLPVLAVGYAFRVFLLAFGGLLFAIFLRSLAIVLSRYTRLPRFWSLLLVILLLLLIGAAAVWGAAPRVSHQIDELATKIPQSAQELEGWLKNFGWGQRVIEIASRQYHTMVEQGTLVSRTTSYLYSTIWAITGVIMVLFIGLYLSSEPTLYEKGLLRCIPAGKRQRAGEVVQGLEHVLQRWLMGKLISMSIVGVLTGIGLWALGVPLALTLALIAAVLAFIPNFGPVISAVPAVLLGLLQGPMMALYVILLYVAVQFFESYMITPLVQKWAVSLPPVLLIVFQVLMGVLAGTLGLIFSTPLLAALIVLVEMLYIQDYLEERVEVAGGSDPRKLNNSGH